MSEIANGEALIELCFALFCCVCAMIEREELITEKQGNKSFVFTIGTTEFTVLDGDRRRIFAKGSLTHVIEEPRLVARVFEKFVASN